MTKCKLSNRLKLGIARIDMCRFQGDGLCQEERKIMAMHGAKYLDRGSFRSAYTFKVPPGLKNPNCVVKLPCSNTVRDVSSNIAEIGVWNQLPKNAKKYFIHIHDFNKDGSYITQPKVATLRSLGYGSNSPLLQRFRDDINRKGILCTDLHNDNLGTNEDDVRNITTSKIKILDYGISVSCIIKGQTKELADIYDIESRKSEKKLRKTSSSSGLITSELFKMFED